MDPARDPRRAGRDRGRGRRQLGDQRLRVGPAALQPETGPEGPLVGDLCGRRQPDRLHPGQQHPPARPLARPARQNLKNATVAIEDRNFFNHGALDPAGIARAAWKDLLAGGKPVQGASTITQQLVRNLYIQDPEETIEAKADRSPPRLRGGGSAHQAVDPHRLPQHRALRDGRRGDRGRRRGGGADLLRQARQRAGPDARRR